MARQIPCGIIVAGMIILGGCGGESRDTGEARTVRPLAPQSEGTVPIDSQPLPSPPAVLPARPRERVDTLPGEERSIVRSRLTAAHAGFPVPFSTYVPADLRVESDTTGGIGRVHFTTRDARGEAAVDFMLVRIYPAGTTMLEVENEVRELVASRGAGIDEATPAEPPGWALRSLVIAYPASAAETHVGTASIGQYGPRFFDVITLVRAESADRLTPQFSLVLDHWRWDDTGMMLKR